MSKLERRSDRIVNKVRRTLTGKKRPSGGELKEAVRQFNEAPVDPVAALFTGVNFRHGADRNEAARRVRSYVKESVERAVHGQTVLAGRAHEAWNRQRINLEDRISRLEERIRAMAKTSAEQIIEGIRGDLLDRANIETWSLDKERDGRDEKGVMHAHVEGTHV